MHVTVNEHHAPGCPRTEYREHHLGLVTNATCITYLTLASNRMGVGGKTDEVSNRASEVPEAGTVLPCPAHVALLHLLKDPKRLKLLACGGSSGCKGGNGRP